MTICTLYSLTLISVPKNMWRLLKSNTVPRSVVYEGARGGGQPIILGQHPTLWGANQSVCSHTKSVAPIAPLWLRYWLSNSAAAVESDFHRTEYSIFHMSSWPYLTASRTVVANHIRCDWVTVSASHLVEPFYSHNQMFLRCIICFVIPSAKWPLWTKRDFHFWLLWLF